MELGVGRTIQGAEGPAAGEGGGGGGGSATDDIIVRRSCEAI